MSENPERTIRTPARSLRRLVIGVAVYACVGAGLTYASTFIAVWFLPIPTMGYSCTGRRVHLSSGKNDWYMRLREWPSPYGSYFQIHRSSAAAASTPGGAFEDASTETDPTEYQRRIERPANDSLLPPPWTVLYDEWPRSFQERVGSQLDRAYWYELRMGWPLAPLYGRYSAVEGATGPATAVSSWGTALFVRNVAYTGPWSKFPILVGMPLVPIWPAFLASSAFYGLVTFFVVWLIRRIRQTFRRKPGHCVACGYDLRGTPQRCPECGTVTNGPSASLGGS